MVFDKTGITEFEDLHKALLKLINENVTAYRQQKEFTENASHELQTPLAIIKSKLDLLLQDKSLTEKQSEAIEMLNLSLSRITRINKNLLLLAKLEGQQFIENHPINLSLLVNEIANLFDEMAEGRKIYIVKEVEENVFISANKSLVEILVSNLVMNAIRHNDTGEKILIQLTRNELTIGNTGKKSLNIDNLYRRFISASPDSPGSGLGLSIVNEICNRYEWKVNYRFDNNQHIFSIFF